MTIPLINGPSRVGFAALKEAQRHIGVREEPPGSNRGPLIDKWNEGAGVPVGSPYCEAFQHTAVWLPVGVKLGGGAYTPATVAWGQAQGYERRRPWRGYLVFFDWDRDGTVDHAGIVEKVLALRWKGGRFVGLIRTVEANTSAGILGSQSDGGGVHRRLRWVNPGTRFLRIPDEAVKKAAHK